MDDHRKPVLRSALREGTKPLINATPGEAKWPDSKPFTREVISNIAFNTVFAAILENGTPEFSPV